MRGPKRLRSRQHRSVTGPGWVGYRWWQLLWQDYLAERVTYGVPNLLSAIQIAGTFVLFARMLHAGQQRFD